MQPEVVLAGDLLAHDALGQQRLEEGPALGGREGLRTRRQRERDRAWVRARVAERVVARALLDALEPADLVAVPADDEAHGFVPPCSSKRSPSADSTRSTTPSRTL